MNSYDFEVYLNTLRQKGNLAYEYNPFHNYQTDVDLYLIDNKFIVPKGQAVNIKNGELLINKGTVETPKWVDKRGKEITQNIRHPSDNDTPWAKAGSVIDFDTEKLNFDLDHPVEIEVQPSYDGSVNLILNDDKNIPRLINSRFSVREKDTYEIVDRIGENDTNIYNSKTFDKDTSLYFQYESNPTVTYLGFVKGVLPVGQYCFYFTYCDADENESDYIAESGLIPVFIGSDQSPTSMDGGIKNQVSHKGIQLRLDNIDKSYNYLKVYYVRFFADYNQNRVYECKKIIKKVPVNSNTLYLQITGNELTEDLDANILNITKFNPKNILTQAQCKNMLFFGNIVKNSDNYKELSDLALRIIPELNVVKNFDTLNNQYQSDSGAYYNSINIYSKTGYFNQEYYRFGVVFIYQNGTLSNVYNTLGGVLKKTSDLSVSKLLYSISNDSILNRHYIKVNDQGWIDDQEVSGELINSKGVCQLNYDSDEGYDDRTIFSIKFNVPGEVSKWLKEELGIRGLFFVRQKCIPNILAQCYLLSMDETLEAPILEETINNNKEYYTECFLTEKERTISHNYQSRLYKYQHKDEGPDKAISTVAFAGLCPDFSLNQPYYNQIFNGGKFRLQKISTNSELKRNNRFFNENSEVKYKINEGFKKVIISTVTENVSTVALKDKIYRLQVGEAEESFRFRYAEIDTGVYNAGQKENKSSEATNLVRGIYSPYLAIYSENGTLETGCLYNIYQDNPINKSQDFLNRMNFTDPFYAISDRYNLVTSDQEYICWRGDCYINQYTHRMSRNFNDPSLPNNDEIIDPNTWKENYDTSDSTKWADISRSDLNAVQIGSWITFKVRSAMNYALRSVDHSYVSEEALMGAPRSFYPRSSLLQRGPNKLPDSYLYNDAYRTSLGFKCYFTLQDVNYIKDTFSNRIQYSAIAIQDSFKNNYRESLSTYFRDYSQEYGSIQKLIGFEGYLLVVFEHAIGIAVINERILAGQSDGEPVFINTKNVLPEELTIISDTYGTQWGDSVVKSEAGYVYGVDTIAKKIWRVKGQQIEILSDFKVNKFLIDTISLGERELYPTIGLKNVKSHYNNNKKDIMFTFYDDIYQDEEKVWNLCYNELLGAFITFYSWVPSFSANIDTKFFTFDRDTAKELSLLAKCNYSIQENQGVLVDNPVCDDSSLQFEQITIDETLVDEINENGFKIISSGDIILPDLYYSTINKQQVINYTVINNDETSSIKTLFIDGESDGNGRYKLENVEFKLEKDHWGNHKLFKIEEVTETETIEETTITIKKQKLLLNDNVEKQELYEKFQEQKVIILYVTPFLSKINDDNIQSGTFVQTNFHTEVIALTLNSIVNNPMLTKDEKTRAGLTTDFYLHGQAGIFNVVENLYPTYWYNKWHPFEFEFVVNDKIGQQKIFNNLVIISNKAEPESFHFEIEGDNYEFSSDKRTMYFRQEATKNLYQNLGSDILYDRYYTDVAARMYTQEQYYRDGNYEGLRVDRVYPILSEGLVKQVKSTIFPLYYERVDTYNEIYHSYREMMGNGYDFKNLSGSEILWNRDLNQFDIVTHIKNSPIDKVGRLRGNSFYKEGKWNIQIPSIIFNQKNEDTWTDNKPPIIVNSQYIPNDLSDSEISIDKLPNIYTRTDRTNGDVSENIITDYIKIGDWTARKEARIRDKWMKVRIRYSGKNLAIIHSIATLYNLSYS